MKKNTLAFIDVDTQFDFMHPEGKLYVPGAETLVPNLVQLLNHAKQAEIPVLASVDAHQDLNDPEFKIFPPHCVKGTPGQTKIDATRIDSALVVDEGTQTLDLTQASAVVVEKTVFDMFGNPNTEKILSALGAKECIVFGVATDYCVKAAALGLRARGYQVHVVTDAIKAVTPETEKEALDAMARAGVKWITTAEVLGRNVV